MMMMMMIDKQEQKQGDENDLSVIKESVINALREFLCEDTKLVVVNTNYKTVCRHGDGLSSISTGGSSSTTSVRSSSSSSSSISDFLAQSNEEETYLADQISDLVIIQYDDIQWMTWYVYYDVIYVGKTFVEQAKMMNITNQEDFMEDVTQLALDVSIMEGGMDSRMKGTGLRMSMVGQEVDTFEGLTVPQNTDSDGGNDDSNETIEELDFQQGGTILQWIGITMFLVNLFVFLLLTNLARRRRLERESKAKLDENLLKERAGLVTEYGVNHMLDISRGESLRILRTKKMYHSSWEDSDSEYESPNENEVEEVVTEHKPIRDISIPLGTTEAKNVTSSTGTSVHSKDESSVWYDCVQHMSDENKKIPPRPSLGVEMSVRTSSYWEEKPDETTMIEPNEDIGGTIFHRLGASFMASFTS